MALTPSNMLPLGTPCPDFSLPDSVSQLSVSLDQYKDSPALLVMFICNHCPYVKHVQHELGRLADDFSQPGLSVVAINANDTTQYPEDAPVHMTSLAKALGWRFPYLFDESQAVARKFQAACTPDFFLFDRQKKLVYRGQLDDSRPGNGKPVTGNDLRVAIQHCLQQRPIAAEQKPSVGCNIKWKAADGTKR